MPYLWPICDSSSSYYLNLNAYFTCFPFVLLVIEPICQNKRGKISCKQGMICFHMCLLCHPTFILPWNWNCCCYTYKRQWPGIFISCTKHSASPFPYTLCNPMHNHNKAWRRFWEDWLGVEFISFHAFHFHTQIVLEFQGDAFIFHNFEELLCFNTCEI